MSTSPEAHSCNRVDDDIMTDAQRVYCLLSVAEDHSGGTLVDGGVDEQLALVRGHQVRHLCEVAAVQYVARGTDRASGNGGPYYTGTSRPRTTGRAVFEKQRAQHLQHVIRLHASLLDAGQDRVQGHARGFVPGWRCGFFASPSGFE